MSPADTNSISIPLHGILGERGRTFRLAILAEGFVTIADRLKFREKVREVATRFVSQPPFSHLADRIAIVGVDLTSRRSAKDLEPLKAPPAGYLGNTPFDAVFSATIERVINGNETAVEQLIQSMPELKPFTFDAFAVLINTTIFGGSGSPGDGRVCWFTLNNIDSLFAHEMGHSAFKLADEYSYLQPGEAPRTFGTAETTRGNVTRQTTAALIPWEEFLTPGVPLPSTVAHATCDSKNYAALSTVPAGAVGLFEGGDKFACQVFRPAKNCKMRNLPDPFCPVCTHLIRARLLGGRYLAASADTRGLILPTEFWTHALSLEGVTRMGGASADLVLTYEFGTGNAGIWAISDLLSQPRPLTIEPIGAGWTTLGIVRQGAERFLMTANFFTQTRALFRINVPNGVVTAGSTMQRVFNTTAPEGISWTHTLGVSLGGQGHVLSYDSVTGSVLLERIDTTGGSVAPVIVASNALGAAPWHTGQRCVAVVEIGGAPLIVAVDPVASVMRTARLHLPTGTPPKIFTDVWTSPAGFAGPSVTNTTGLFDTGRALLASYSTLVGYLTVYSVRPDGVGVDYNDRRWLGPGGPVILGTGAPAMGSTRDAVWLFNAAARQFRIVKFV